MSSWRVSSNLTSGTTSLEEPFPIPDTTLQTKRVGVGIRRRVRLWPQPDSLFHPGPRLCNAPGYLRTLGEHLLATTWKSPWTCRAPPQTHLVEAGVLPIELAGNRWYKIAIETSGPPVGRLRGLFFAHKWMIEPSGNMQMTSLIVLSSSLRLRISDSIFLLTAPLSHARPESL